MKLFLAVRTLSQFTVCFHYTVFSGFQGYYCYYEVIIIISMCMEKLSDVSPLSKIPLAFTCFFLYV